MSSMFSSPSYTNCHGNVSILGQWSRQRYPRVNRVLLFAQLAPGSSVSLALGGLCLFALGQSEWFLYQVWVKCPLLSLSVTFTPPFYVLPKLCKIPLRPFITLGLYSKGNVKDDPVAEEIEI